MSEILSSVAHEHLILDYADAAHKCAQHWASAEDDALKVHLGSLLRAHDAALRAENARLRDLLTSARYYVGHAGEMRDAIDAALAPAAPAKEPR